MAAALDRRDGRQDRQSADLRERVVEMRKENNTRGTVLANGYKKVRP